MILKMKSRFFALVLFSFFAPLFPLFADGAEVRRISIRGLRVEPSGDLKIFVSMRDGQNQPISDWDSKHVSIKIDGKVVDDVKLSAQSFAKSGEGRAVLLAFDVSGSMSTGMENALGSTTQFLQSVRPSLDRVAIGKIGSEWALVQDFTSDQNLLRTKIQSLKANDFGTTALFEAIDFGIESLRLPSHRDLPSRRSLIVITDGLNEKAGRTADECIALARNSLVQVNSLIFQPKQSSKMLAAKGEIEKISRDSGGLTSTYTDAKDFSKFFFQLQNDLDSELVFSLFSTSIPRDLNAHSIEFRYQQASDTVRFNSLGPETFKMCEESPCDDTPGWPEHRVKKEPLAQEHKYRSGNYILLFAGFFSFLSGLYWLLRWRRLQTAEVALSDINSVSSPDTNEGRTDSLVAIPDFEELNIRAQRNQLVPAKTRKTEYRAPAEDASQMFALRVVEGECKGFYSRIPVSGARVGRDSSNEIVISSNSVSGLHAEFKFNAQNQLVIHDHNSTNGTFVNGERLSGSSEPLKAGDRVRLGLVSLVIEAV